MEINLPWWANVYLGLAAILSVFGAWSDISTSKAKVFADLVSFFFMFVLVAAFFNASLRPVLGWFVIPVTLLGLGWELYSTAYDMTRAKKEFLDPDRDLSEEEKRAILDLAMIVNGLCIVPGYVAGLALCLDYAGVVDV